MKNRHFLKIFWVIFTSCFCESSWSRRTQFFVLFCFFSANNFRGVHERNTLRLDMQGHFAYPKATIFFGALRAPLYSLAMPTQPTVTKGPLGYPIGPTVLKGLLTKPIDHTVLKGTFKGPIGKLSHLAGHCASVKVV